MKKKDEALARGTREQGQGVRRKAGKISRINTCHVQEPNDPANANVTP